VAAIPDSHDGSLPIPKGSRPIGEHFVQIAIDAQTRQQAIFKRDFGRIGRMAV